MYITAQGCRLRNDLYCVEWDVKLYYTIPYHLHWEGSLAEIALMHRKSLVQVLDVKKSLIIMKAVEYHNTAESEWLLNCESD